MKDIHMYIYTCIYPYAIYVFINTPTNEISFFIFQHVDDVFVMFLLRYDNACQRNRFIGDSYSDCLLLYLMGMF